MPKDKKRIFLIKERKVRKLTQDNVAKCLDISRNHYSLIENGHRTPGFKTAVKISDFFGCKMTDLLPDRTEKANKTLKK